MSNRSGWFVYILRCRDGTFYTGITIDLDRRLAEHNGGKLGARYTKARRPVTLVYAESADSRSSAARREYQLRRMSAEAKRLLAATWPG